MTNYFKYFVNLTQHSVIFKKQKVYESQQIPIYITHRSNRSEMARKPPRLLPTEKSTDLKKKKNKHDLRSETTHLSSAY